MAYTINKINDKGSVDVTFDIDKKKQNISGAPISDAEALTAYLSDYEVAYITGLEATKVEVAKDVAALVGTKIS